MRKLHILISILIIIVGYTIISRNPNTEENNKIKHIIEKQIDVNDVVSIQFIQAGGNPEISVDSKIITKRSELTKFINAINNAQIINKTNRMDIADCDSSDLYIKLTDNSEISFHFNGNETSIVYIDGTWYNIKYENKDIWNLYKTSSAEIIKDYPMRD